MLRVALTGGIGSGKSAAADVFRELGVPVIDTDRIARELVEPGQPGLQALSDEFGDSILDVNGRLDRERLRQRIFSDDAARSCVNALLHPLILDALENELAAIDSAYVVIEIPLLAETGLADSFDRVLVVDANDDIRIKRLQERDGVSKEDAYAALAAQATRDERLRLASDVIENNSSLIELEAAVRALHEKYCAMAKRFATAPDRPSE
ncbi:MAG TPA: dephospho-CoA kinase [Gammaproteobacteria bacterium]